MICTKPQVGTGFGKKKSKFLTVAASLGNGQVAEIIEFEPKKGPILAGFLPTIFYAKVIDYFFQ